MRKAARDQGFTLIEVIVAIAMLAFGLGSLLEGIALGWRGSRAAQMELSALQVAKARLEAAGIETPLTEGRWSGSTSDGFSWTLTCTRHVDERVTADLGIPTGYWTTVEVGWRPAPWSRPRSLVLASFRIGQVE